MRLSFFILLFIDISCFISGQGVTKYGQNAASGTDFVSSTGGIVNTPSLSTYGQELKLATLSTASVSSTTDTSVISGGQYNQ